MSPGLSMDDAAAAIAEAFGPQEGLTILPDAAPPSASATPAVASSASEPAKPPAKVAEPPQESQAPARAPEPSYRPGLYRVNEHGEGELVPDEEIEADRLRMADYTRKTQAVAEQRRQMEADHASLKAERESLAQEKIRTAQVLKAALPPEPDWDALYTQDPQNMAVVHAAWSIRQQQAAKAAQEAQEAQARVQAERQSVERARLLELIPEWKDQATAQKEMAELSQYVVSQGLSPQRINELVSDSAAIRMARKAMLAERGESLAPSRQEKAQIKIDRVKVAAPGAASIPKAPPSEFDRNRAQFLKTGKLKDSVALFDALLKK